VLGVEVSPHLNEIAKANVERMRQRRAKSIELIQSDAAEFVLPSDVNIIYMANPFRGATLRRVVNEIMSSYRKSPRTIYIIYFNKIYFEQLLEETEYRLIKRVSLSHWYPNYSCGIYAIGEPETKHRIASSETPHATSQLSSLRDNVRTLEKRLT